MDEMDDYVMGCTAMDSCDGGAFCLWSGEACTIAFGTANCLFQEQFPPRPNCR